MINDSEKIQTEMIEKTTVAVKSFMAKMVATSHTDEFNIDNIEAMMTEINLNLRSAVLEGSNVIMSTLDEDEIISEKKTEFLEQGIKLKNNEIREKKIQTLNGELTIKRTILRYLIKPEQAENTEEIENTEKVNKKEIVPLDDFLKINNLPFKMTKNLMLEVAYTAQKEGSYEAAKSELDKKYDLDISTSRTRNVTTFIGDLVFEDDKKIAEETQKNLANSIDENAPKVEGELYITTDGAALNTRVQDENGSTWRENKLGLVFGSDKVKKRGKSEKNGHVIVDKEYTSYIGSSEEFGKYLYQAAINKGYGQYKKTILLSDGATWIRNMGKMLFPDAIQILDKFHLKENIYSYAKAVFNNDESKYKTWAEMIIEYIEDGQKNKALEEIKKHKVKKIPKGTVDLATYIKNNFNKINYKEYKEKGYFVGSGAIESANKTILQKRLKQSGMRWSVKTAQSLLTLRSKVESGLWPRVKPILDLALAS